MSEEIIVKKRGRPKKVVAAEGDAATADKKINTKKRTAAAKDEAKGNAETTVPAKRKTSAKSAVNIETSDEIVKPAMPTVQKSPSRKGNDSKGPTLDVTSSVESSSPSTDTKIPSKNPDLSLGSSIRARNQSNLLESSLPGESIPAQTSSPISSAKPPISSLNSSAGSANQGPETADISASVSSPAASTAQSISKSKTSAPASSSKILQALKTNVQQQQSQIQQSSQHPAQATITPTHILSASSGLPNFSASASLNAPSSMSRNKTQKPSSPDMPTGPPNPGQIPFTQQEISSLRGKTDGPSSGGRLPDPKPLKSQARIVAEAAEAAARPKPPPTPHQIEAIKASPQYRAAQGRWVRFMVAAPIAIVTSYVLWQRYTSGTLTNDRPKPLSSSSSPSSTSTSSPSSSQPPAQTPPVLGSSSQSASFSIVGINGGVKPRIISSEEPSTRAVYNISSPLMASKLRQSILEPEMPEAQELQPLVSLNSMREKRLLEV